ncbi:DNA polymerase/3'-5' exonuclease PolX [Salinispira pacifica]
MAIHNGDIADALNELADILDVEGANSFRVRSYRDAARTLRGLSREAADMVERGEDLSDLPGIGSGIASKIRELVETGKLSQLESARERTSPELVSLTEVDQLGPKRVKKLHEVLGVEGPAQLKQAAEQGRIASVEGFGKKTEKRILDELERLEQTPSSQRFTLDRAEETTEPLLAYLRGLDPAGNVTAAGSYRRRRETVGDLDIIITTDDPDRIMEAFTEYENVDRVAARGRTRSTVVLISGMQVDLRVVEPESYGAALYYFTGSKAHNVATRKIAVDRGWKMNEYGLFDGKRRLAGRSEEELFAAIDLAPIPPELRENRGEIDAARDNRLPHLLTESDIRGDLQTHTDATDGQLPLEEMVEAAVKRGYEYYAVTDHSKRVSVAGGLDADALRRQHKSVDRLNERLAKEGKEIVVLRGVEVDILQDGTLDLPDELLAACDLVVASIHYDREMSEEKMTERILRALDNRCVNILGHPTGRMIGEAREPMRFDVQRIMRAALDRGVFLEVNAQPERLDLSDIHCRRAKEMGLKLAVSTDAHTASHLSYMKYGVAQACRGWIEADDVINTRPLPALRKLLER